LVLRLMITADDCGISHGIDRAAIDLFHAGMLSSASIMTNFPNVEAAFERYTAAPDLELGIHFNLSEGKPLTEAARRSRLVRRSGLFHDRFLLFARSFFPSQQSLSIIREELKAQMNVFTKAGVQPAHITTHHHFHTMPALYPIVKELAEEYQVTWVRNSNLRLSIVPYAPIFSRKPDTSKIKTPNYITMLKMWMEYPPEILLSAILRLDGWVELVIHPSLPKDPSYPSDVIYSPAERHQEVLYLETFFKLLQPHLGSQVEIFYPQVQGRRMSHA
jgi:predicted glycoside hydrolase/deacetylase ChbG (UPF0249 family)